MVQGFVLLGCLQFLQWVRMGHPCCEPSAYSPKTRCATAIVIQAPTRGTHVISSIWNSQKNDSWFFLRGNPSWLPCRGCLNQESGPELAHLFKGAGGVLQPQLACALLSGCAPYDPFMEYRSDYSTPSISYPLCSPFCSACYCSQSARCVCGPIAPHLHCT